MRNALTLPVEGTECRLRLTMAGQRALCREWGEEILPFLLGAATDPDRLCALLTQALTWPESGNPITDGAALYDALVDGGWQGQGAFAALVFELGTVSGLLTREQGEELTAP
jgi:hypothetical protein